MIRVMRRFILLFATCIFASIAWSQSVTIQFKNGNTVKYDMSEIQSISFDEEESEGEESPSLIGTWDVVSNKFYDDNGQETKEDNETSYWVFTATTLTVYDEGDLFDGKAANYTFDGNLLTVGGLPIWTVVSLDNNTMVLRAKTVGGYQETTLEKR
jgi:hypothetical protein